VQLEDALFELPDAIYSLGLVLMQRVEIAESPAELCSAIDDFAHEMLRSEREMPPETRKPIRDLLRQGGFKPSGRNRPASEYLANDLATRGAFNFINNLVDINNFLSLQYFVPMSVLDADVFKGRVHLRFGRAGERYIFNPAGQELDLEGLLLTADLCDGESIPLGSPIKDSMAGKLTPETKSALVVVYSHPGVTTDEQMAAMLEEWCDLSARYASAEGFATRVLSRTEK